MSETRRLLDGGGDELERLVVQAGHDEAPSRDVRRRADVALGLAGAAVVTTTSAAAASSVAAAKGAPAAATAVLVKWIGLGVIASAGVVGTTVALHAVSARSEAPVASVSVSAPQRQPGRATAQSGPTVTPASSETASAEAPPVEPPQPAAALPSPTSARPGAPPPASGAATAEQPGLAEELQLVDAARAALAAGDTARATQLLDEHDLRFDHPALAAEALVVRIDVYAARGDRTRTAELCRRFLDAYPDRPQAQHVRSVLASLGTSP